MNVGSVVARLGKTGLPAVEVVTTWRRGRSTGSVGKPRTRLVLGSQTNPNEPGSRREGPQLMVEAGA